jgi:EAL domain-containing protein (putative c-di-GMP-specific phosphodiesterase class I)
MTGLADELARALAGNELFLVYQPKVALPSRRWCGVEALARWHHPERGLLPPIEFIPVAESSGLIRQLTQRVLDLALAQLREWGADGLAVPIAVNISARDIEEGFPDLFERACRQNAVQPELVTFELTETATHDLINLLDVGTRLRLKKARLSIDDFGTGYSSVVQLHQLPFSELKIDQLFVSELGTSADARTIVRAVVDLAHALGLNVVAEGVEDRHALEFLIKVSCDEVQGFYFSHPVEAAKITELWRALAGRKPA